MDCLERALSFGITEGKLINEQANCKDLPCYENCPILNKLRQEED